MDGEVADCEHDDNCYQHLGCLPARSQLTLSCCVGQRETPLVQGYEQDTIRSSKPLQLEIKMTFKMFFETNCKASKVGRKSNFNLGPRALTDRMIYSKNNIKLFIN